MNWRALENNECPECGDELTDSGDGIMRCQSCDFGIREERMVEILGDIELDDAYRPYGPHDRIV